MKLIDKEIAGPKRDYVGYGRHLPKVYWPNGAKVAINFVINYEEGSERMKPLGDIENEGAAEFPQPLPNEFRDLCTESIYEYGSRAGIWRLQRLFDDTHVPATIFGCAVAFERNPEVGEWIREAGHDVCCHGWRWEEVFRLSREEEKNHMKRAIASIEESCGTRPLGWYCRYGASVNTRELIVEEGGFLYDSDSYNDDLPYFTNVNENKHLIIPYSMTLNDAKFILTNGYGSPTAFYDHLKRALDYLWDEGETHPKMMSIGLHPRMIGQPARISALKEFIQYAQQKGDIWFARRLDIANWWLRESENFKR